MRPVTVLALLRTGLLEPGLTALVWLLVEGGLPIVVPGSAGTTERKALAGALLSIDPDRAWLVLDADAEPPTLTRLSALLQGGAGIGITLTAGDLTEALERLHGGPGQLPFDAIRRLGLVLTADQTGCGTRCRVVHYLRPTERDGQGHVQRRPPAILASWDEAVDRYDDYAWGITPELAQRVGRTQAGFEERLQERTAFLDSAAGLDHISAGDWADRVRRQLEGEASRTLQVAEDSDQG